MSKLPSVDDLTIWYKYVATMTFVKRSYTHFKQSILEKEVYFLRGKAEIHVVPFYFHSTGIYYQPIFDFDKCNSKAEVLNFIQNELLTNKHLHESDVFVELSPNGIHVGLKHAFGPITVEDVRTIRNYVRHNIQDAYPHLDAISSIRFMAISRTPSMLKHKRMFAMTVRYFKSKSITELRVIQEKLKTIRHSFFIEQVDKYLFLQSIKPLDYAPSYILKSLNDGVKSSKT